MTHAHPKLKPYDFNPEPYDLIIIGSPVWAGSPTPALNTFLEETRISGKKLALFCCHLGGKGKFFDKVKARLPGNTIAGEIDFIKPRGQDQEGVVKKLEEWLRSLSS
jgi:hypothetical protein